MYSYNLQESSPFFSKLPAELRLEIYEFIFCSTCLSFVKQTRDKAKDGSARLLPDPNGLSALRVCRRFNEEIGDRWLGQVLLSFHDPLTVLKKLSALDQQTLGKLRNLRFWCSTPMVEKKPGAGMRFRLSNFLGMLSGLNLDRLIISGPHRREYQYLELDALIRGSNGWKELYYVSASSEMLGFEKTAVVSLLYSRRTVQRAPQPSTWTEAIAARDGPTASVTIYRCTDEVLKGSMIYNSLNRQVFTDQVAKPGRESEYGVERDTALMAPGERNKEILVVVKRGKNVDSTEKGNLRILKRYIINYHTRVMPEERTGPLPRSDDCDLLKYLEPYDDDYLMGSEN
ncbi:hypothetical protein KVR01_012261 [Diaporthe batatas]|uniref:uncharacterized protein n=1 Tax=Diaporthe batatas TaxID=748121 RepID=UPI001D042648|nr:uncharacterized protein KVR01_012261 [Diaporthe batatas]KAG8157989.1 hypothetical protein KVR01_012261 [Diaporthe batatas]